MTRSIVDLCGQKFGQWIVLRKDSTKKAVRESYWICVCECGTARSVRRSKLTRGESLSCGCLYGKSREKHAMSNTKEYKTWLGIKKRCENPKASNWHQYGGAGVTICKKWKDSFLTFYEDMGPAPSGHHSIDRIDNSKGYCKENCRWATAKQQARNKTNNRKIEIAGKSKTIAEWIEYFDLDISPTLVYQRLRQGMSIEVAFTRPPEAYRARKALKEIGAWE